MMCFGSVCALWVTKTLQLEIYSMSYLAHFLQGESDSESTQLQEVNQSSLPKHRAVTLQKYDVFLTGLAKVDFSIAVFLTSKGKS